MEELFQRTLGQIGELVDKNPDELLLEICRLLKEKIYHYDWVGFYLLKQGELVLGPYSGAPTEHIRIQVGKGICGQVAEKRKTMIVQDVTTEDNYISCSLDVQSEIVVPVLKDGKFLAELDIDSHSPAPFSQDDVLFLENICKILTESIIKALSDTNTPE